ncbi:DUF3574 domain-containing protein [Luteimonas sp. SX5]|uniref:DUF3574 domain-containing protein n=1 Tax=Luteimonas galliterrae TaxID=2940486 RepID=A0ABT0MGP8_9GAMM|nr:DUF3574 domain-containing protein [Luteimonas galliterrae]MCL1634067.1 DUF3574 domain-containing protein [Luteimonas galliterrae]
MMTRWLSSLVLLGTLAGCASAPLQPIAQTGTACSEKRSDRLLFGMNTPTGPVDETQWQAFLADTVTPRFPDGLTVYRTQGQWRGASGQVEREESRMVEIVHEDDPDGRKRIAEISAEYKRRFQQEAVLVISTRAQACL